MRNKNTFINVLKKTFAIKRLFIAVLFISICVFLFISASYAINRVKDSIESQYIEDGGNLVRAYSNAFQNIVTQANLSLDMYAANEIFSKGTSEQISSWLINHRSMHPQNLLDIFYCDTTGTAYLDTGERLNVQDRPYFNAIMSGEYIYYLGTALRSKHTGKMFIQLCRAIFSKDDKLKGFVAGTIELSQIQKLLADTQSTNSPTPFILDENGAFISHINDRNLMKTFEPNIEEFKQYSTIKVAQNDIPFFKTISVRGENVHVFTQKIKGTRWTAGVTISDKKIYETYYRLERGKRIVFLAVIIAGILLHTVFEISLAFIKNHKEKIDKYDPLTDLYTRQYFEREAALMMKEDKNGRFILIEADFLGFKFINRNYGEEAGSKTLIIFANTVRELCSMYGGIAARGYADHFYYFNQINSLSKTVSYMRSSIEAIEKIATTAEIPFTPKYGISFVTPEKPGNINSGKKTVEQLIGEATLARNTIKNKNEVSYAVFNLRMARRIQLEQKIERNQERALAHGEFYVVYQPKIDLLTDKIIGAEALVRWNSPELGFLGPDKFIPLFETNGFIKKLDFAVYEMVFKFIKKQLDAGEPIVTISINMSRNHVSAASFINEFMERFNKYNIPPKYVEIELLERSVANEKPILQEITEELHKKGFTVAMDDFGSGESSLNMLNSVPIDTLKFDQNFLRNNTDELKTHTFITSLMRMAQQLKKKTVFEGVETEAQRDFLKSINCDSVQGYFYSKPLSEEDFIQFVKEHL